MIGFGVVCLRWLSNDWALSLVVEMSHIGGPGFEPWLQLDSVQ